MFLSSTYRLFEDHGSFLRAQQRQQTFTNFSETNSNMMRFPSLKDILMKRKKKNSWNPTLQYTAEKESLQPGTKLKPEKLCLCFGWIILECVCLCVCMCVYMPVHVRVGVCVYVYRCIHRCCVLPAFSLCPWDYKSMTPYSWLLNVLTSLSDKNECILKRYLCSLIWHHTVEIINLEKFEFAQVFPERRGDCPSLEDTYRSTCHLDKDL